MKKKPSLTRITEGTTSIYLYTKQNGSTKGPGKKIGLPFYNPSMTMNRDISILILQHLLHQKKGVCHALDGMAASGIRGFRFALELKGEVHITINDWADESFQLIKKNAKTIPASNLTLSKENIHILLSQKPYDYIDIDPFGSPAIYIDAALRSIRNNGIIAVTATDTATLCGVYPTVCKRRYNATPTHGSCMHETALRTLIGFIGRQAGKYDKAIYPVLSYHTDHYLRCYLRIKKGVTFSNQSIDRIYEISSAEIPGQKNKKSTIGPLWMGEIHDKQTCQSLLDILPKKHLQTKHQMSNLLILCEQEAMMPPFYYSTNTLSHQYKKSPPPLETMIQAIQEKGFHITKTQFDPTGFKTTADRCIVEQIFQQLTL